LALRLAGHDPEQRQRALAHELERGPGAVRGRMYVDQRLASGPGDDGRADVEVDGAFQRPREHSGQVRVRSRLDRQLRRRWRTLAPGEYSSAAPDRAASPSAARASSSSAARKRRAASSPGLSAAVAPLASQLRKTRSTRVRTIPARGDSLRSMPMASISTTL